MRSSLNLAYATRDWIFLSLLACLLPLCFPAGVLALDTAAALTAADTAPTVEGAETAQNTPPSDTESDFLFTMAVTDFDITTDGADKKQAEVLSNLLVQIAETVLCSVDSIGLVERRKTREILDEQYFGQNGGNVESSAQQVGALLGAKYVLTGGFILFGANGRLDIKIIDVKSGRIVAAKSANMANHDFNTINAVMTGTTQQLIAKLVPDYTPPPPPVVASPEPKQLKTAPPPAAQPSAPVQKRHAIADASIDAFVRSYLTAYNAGNIDALLEHYGDAVDLLNIGIVPKKRIRKELGFYFRLWPMHQRKLEGDIQVYQTSAPHLKRVEYFYEYTMNNGKKTRNGLAQDIYLLAVSPDGLEIISEKNIVHKRR